MERLVVRVGGLAAALATPDPAFRRMLEERYAGFIDPAGTPDFELGVELVAPEEAAADEDVRVFRHGGAWRVERGDFRAEFDPASGRGRVRQSANPYSIDTLLRILHTLALARQGGFLMHAASAVRNGRAFVFTGVSGAGKTTLSRLAPPDVHLLTDEISYVRREAEGYFAYGTPFAGELARPGENLRAPLGAVYLLAQGPEHRSEPLGAAEAAQGLLRNLLFFAEDPELVRAVFHSALDLAERVPVRRLVFAPDAGAWELIG